MSAETEYLFYIMARPDRYGDRDAYAYWWEDARGQQNTRDIQFAHTFTREEAALKCHLKRGMVAIPVEVAKQQAVLLARSADVMDGLVNHAQKLMTGG